MYEFRPATRSEAKPLIGLYSQSGCGKTYSALLLARGFAGSKGKIGMIETESGRGEAYADPQEYPEIGGYLVLPLRDDFSPAAYGKAITAAEKAQLDALIIDSASHEWEGAGGVLGMAAENQAKGSKGVLVWQGPKQEHKRQFMLRFMQTSIPLVILCMRAKYPMREVKDERGKKEWVRSDDLDPIQADDILFEMFVHGWIDHGHKFHRTKCTAKALEPVFRSGQPLTQETGRALAAWAKGAAKSTESEVLPDTTEQSDAGGQGPHNAEPPSQPIEAGASRAIPVQFDFQGSDWLGWRDAWEEAVAACETMEQLKALKDDNLAPLKTCKAEHADAYNAIVSILKGRMSQLESEAVG
ncbi:MAG: AAA family ATPase [Reyranella sp.]|uniref:hypothetical protein n=1 Tax=Reyranella sp. TaxID=1929291 RepID=UPI003D0FCD07